jgi:hypothetical protein
VSKRGFAPLKKLLPLPLDKGKDKEDRVVDDIGWNTPRRMHKIL